MKPKARRRIIQFPYQSQYEDVEIASTTVTLTPFVTFLLARPKETLACGYIHLAFTVYSFFHEPPQ